LSDHEKPVGSLEDVKKDAAVKVSVTIVIDERPCFVEAIATRNAKTTEGLN
jgi:hypothetical protein